VQGVQAQNRDSRWRSRCAESGAFVHSIGDVRSRAVQPTPNANYDVDRSIAVVKIAHGAVQVAKSETATKVAFDTGAMRVTMNKGAFRLRVFRGPQLVHSDDAGFGLVSSPENSSPRTSR
jgi:hypothetical protein